MQTIDAARALQDVTDYWTPKVIGQVNDQYVKVAKLKGVLVWHQHEHEDEMFLVIYGTMTLQFKDREVHLSPGQFCVVPKATMHNPVAREECGIMLIESVTTRHTGDLVLPRTVSIERQLGSTGVQGRAG